MNTPYEKINKYCDNKRGATDKHKALMLYKYYKDYYDAIEGYKDKNNKEPGASECLMYEDQLLRETSLESSFTISSLSIEEDAKKVQERYERKSSIKEFFISVFASVLASIIFALLLMGVVRIAHDQVKSFVADLYRDNQEITSEINQENYREDTASVISQDTSLPES